MVLVPVRGGGRPRLAVVEPAPPPLPRPKTYTTRGAPTIAQATDSRRFMPPENLPACTFAHLWRLTAASAVPTALVRCAGATERSLA